MAVIKTHDLSQLIENITTGFQDVVMGINDIGTEMVDLAATLNGTPPATMNNPDGGTTTTTFTKNATSQSSTVKETDGALDFNTNSETTEEKLTGKTDGGFLTKQYSYTNQGNESNNSPTGASNDTWTESHTATLKEHADLLADETFVITDGTWKNSGSSKSANYQNSDNQSKEYANGSIKGEFTISTADGFTGGTLKSYNENYGDSYSNDDHSRSSDVKTSMTSKNGIAIANLLSDTGPTLTGTADTFSTSETFKGSYNSDDGSTQKYGYVESYSGALSQAMLTALATETDVAATLLAGDDTITLSGYGGYAGGSVNGYAGKDTITGSNGYDTIHGGEGNDTLNGGKGGDSLYGDAGDDTLNGGDGQDYLSGGDGNDTLNGGNSQDDLYGDAGNDTLNGGNGQDYLNGGDGNDTLNGGNGQDVLHGGTGDDVLKGEAGNDLLKGGLGIDTLTGGAGNDVFYASSTETDKVTDFNAKQDALDFYGNDNDTYGYNLLLSKDHITVLATAAADYDAALVAANAAFADTSDDIVVVKVGKDSYVFADIDGNHVSDANIELLNTTVTAETLKVYEWSVPA